MKKPVDNPQRKRARTTADWVRLVQLVVAVAAAVVLPADAVCGDREARDLVVAPAGSSGIAAADAA